MRGTVKRTEVERWGGEQARRCSAGSLKPLQDLHLSQTALWTYLRSRLVFIFLVWSSPNNLGRSKTMEM